jgi:hypothetical protein
MNWSKDSLVDHWIALAAEVPSGENRMRIRDIQVDTDWGNVAVGIDFEGHHHLLVPIASSARIRGGIDGPGLKLTKRPLENADSYAMFADLACLRPELDYLFDDLCSDVLDELDGAAPAPLKALYRVIDRWKALFERPTGALSTENATGLFAELMVLIRLLEIDSSAHRCWRGPLGDAHDFVGESSAIEVKGTTSTEGRQIRVHGLDQLGTPESGRLELAWYRLQQGTGTEGLTLKTLADRVLALADDEPAVLRLLAGAGYVPGVMRANDERRFKVTENLWFSVDDEFPRLTTGVLECADIHAEIRDVHYTADISHLTALSEEAVSGRLDLFGRGSA